jgi:hypothetical protein
MKNYFVRFIYNQAVVSITVSSESTNPDEIIAMATEAIAYDIGFDVSTANDIDIEEF